MSTRTIEPISVVLASIVKERLRQDAKWGEQNHHPFTWTAIAGEEFGEVCQAALKATYGGATWADYRKELVQAAAVLVAMVECLDRHGGQPPEGTWPQVGT